MDTHTFLLAYAASDKPRLLPSQDLFSCHHNGSLSKHPQQEPHP